MAREVQSPDKVKVVTPKPEETVPKVPEAPVEEKPSNTVRFLRNTGPVTKIIVFEDGTPYKFETYGSVVLDAEADKETIENIRRVARKFHIYEDKNHR